MSDPTLTVVVPAYNEEASLPSFLPELIAFCEEHGFRIIVVDDGSTDSTAGLLREFEQHACLRCLRHKLNRGYGAAIKTGHGRRGRLI